RSPHGHAVHARVDQDLRSGFAGVRWGARLGPRGVRSAAGREGRARPTDDGTRRASAPARARTRSLVVRSSPPTVLIAGGGPVGLALAALLVHGESSVRVRVRVLEARPAPR